MSGLSELIRDQADVSFGSIHPSLSSSLSESSDSESSIATRLARMEATSKGAVLRSNSFCSDFSTFRRVMPKKQIVLIQVWWLLVAGSSYHLEWPSSSRCVGHGMEAVASWQPQCAGHRSADLASRHWPAIWVEFGVAAWCAGCHHHRPSHPQRAAVVAAGVVRHWVATFLVSAVGTENLLICRNTLLQVRT